MEEQGKLQNTETPGQRQRAARTDSVTDEWQPQDEDSKSKRLQGQKRSVAMHVGYVGTAFNGERVRTTQR